MKKSKFFVAAAIPYVNAKPHLGHALLFTYGDVLARYWRTLGCEVIFSIGTDEHGSKIAEAAADLKIDPQAFVDQISVKFKHMAKRLAISNTHFIRTTDANHCQKIQLIWQQLKEYIYKDIYEGWYCLSCEAYQTETDVKINEGICPVHKRAYELLKEENYFFKLSAFSDVLREKIATDELRIVPSGAKAEVLSMIDMGLEDISVSRLAKNLKWGIEVPDDPEQVIYVWLDALSNYITVLSYPNGAEFKSHWPADIQIIGRDILRQHAVYWPAFLLGLKLPLYRQLYAHGLITVDGQKMSKTLGNVVNPLDLVEKYGLEAFRYFFLRHLPAYDNGDYSLKRFVNAYNNELVDQLGNLVRRLQALIWQKLDGYLPLTAGPDLKEKDILMVCHQAFEDCRFDYALNLIFAEIKDLNKKLESSRPWAIDDLAEVGRILDQVSANLMIINLLLQPFLPGLSERISEIFAANPIKKTDRPLLEKISEN